MCHLRKYLYVVALSSSVKPTKKALNAFIIGIVTLLELSIKDYNNNLPTINSIIIAWNIVFSIPIGFYLC